VRDAGPVGIKIGTALWSARAGGGKRRYDAVFVNRFDPIPAGTLFTVWGELRFKGTARLLWPILRWYVLRQTRRLQLEPVKVRAEASGFSRSG